MRMLYSSFLEAVTGRVGGLLLNGGTDVYNEVLRHHVDRIVGRVKPCGLFGYSSL
jgi:hypothetical protein